MARRKQTSTAEDLMDLVAMLPWWAGVALAVITYFFLHRVAAQQVVATVQPGQMGTMMTQTMWKSFATVGQYLLPFICLTGAGMSAWRRRERKALVHNVVQSDSADALNGMSWLQFEQLVGEAFRLQGYKVVELGGAGADGGVDLVLNKGGEKFLVQCKQWRAFKVGVDVVRELYGVMAARGAAGGFVVTSGRFTAEATEFSAGRNVALIDGPKLHGLMQQVGATRNVAAPTVAPTVKQTRGTPTAAATATPARPSSSPACPKCSKPMVKRTARRGASAGGEFWGCTGYPACKGTAGTAGASHI